jgi:hypothetical protein
LLVLRLQNVLHIASLTAIVADLGYKLPSTNAFDRVIDHDTPWRSGNQLGGVSLNGDFKIGPGTLTSTTAYRYWNWDPSTTAILQVYRYCKNHKTRQNITKRLKRSVTRVIFLIN